MTYCEFIKCGDYTESRCKAFTGNIRCKTAIEAEPYASACVTEAIAANNKWWVDSLKGNIHSFCQQQLCNKHGINQAIAQKVKEELGLWVEQIKKEATE